MPATWYECMHPLRRPRWDNDGGLWYCVQGASTDGAPTKLYRHKPSVNHICEPLLGTSLRNEKGKIIGVKYPTLAERLKIYREGIEVVRVFKDYDDLVTLAMYRRQVTRRGGIHIDLLFFNLACDAHFPQTTWAMLAERMPDRAPIYQACRRRATLGPSRLEAVA